MTKIELEAYNNLARIAASLEAIQQLVKELVAEAELSRSKPSGEE